MSQPPSLVLIAGITGTFGHHLAASSLRRGLQVRGVSRSPGKLDPIITKQLESFIRIKNYNDIDAISKAVTGVDAIFVAYSATLEMYLEAQMILLREAEKAGVKIFHAQTWNFNWRRLKFGEMEYYDANISFCRQVELTSTIRPVYVFSGIFAHRIYLNTGPGCFTLNGDGNAAVMEYWGDSPDQVKYTWTSLRDAAEQSIELVMTEPDVLAGKGGFYCISSGEDTIVELAKAYEEHKKIPVKIQRRGSLLDLEAKVAEMRESLGAAQYFQWLRYNIVLLALQGKWEVENFREFRHIEKTCLRELLSEDHTKVPPTYTLDKGFD